MASVTLSTVALRDALRLGDSTEETAVATRLLAVSTALVERKAPDAPGAVLDEAVIRLSAFWFDQPPSSRYSFGYAMGRSGAGSILLPFRVLTAHIGDDEDDEDDEEELAMTLELTFTGTVVLTAAVPVTGRVTISTYSGGPVDARGSDLAEPDPADDADWVLDGNLSGRVSEGQRIELDSYISLRLVAAVETVVVVRGPTAYTRA